MWDREVDVLAVGSGLGGLSAAIAAHDAGCDTLVIEKAPMTLTRRGLTSNFLPVATPTRDSRGSFLSGGPKRLSGQRR